MPFLNHGKFSDIFYIYIYFFYISTVLYTSGGLTTVCLILSSSLLQLKFSYLSIIVKLTCVANKSYYIFMKLNVDIYFLGPES